MSKRVIILATDTPHRRYFIKRIIALGIPIAKVIFETNLIEPSFPVGPFYRDEESAFERGNFFTEFNDSLEGIAVEYVDNINDDQSKRSMSDVQADLALVFGTRKITTAVIDFFPDGMLNVHRGIAQSYRGLDTNLWAIYHDDFSNIGVTIHDVAEKLDTGHIVKQSVLDLPASTKIYQMRFYETILATDLAIESLNDYLNGEIQYKAQPEIGRYYSFMPLVIKQLLPAKLERYLKNVCPAI